MEDKNKDNNSSKSVFAQREEEILDFWQENKIFNKTLEKKSPKGEYVFYDGPPFATGLPHYGHAIPSVMKDVIPRYKTMKGYHVPRNWGWDCHGLPIENLIQKENNLETKADIEKFGIKNFSQKAKNSVFLYDKEWKRIIPRIGRWVDMENQYTTMDKSFMESVWWAFKKLYNKGLVYEGFKSIHISPKLETSLSNFEVNQGYKDITDISVYAKFELKDEPGTFLIAWTTTPWTLFGNTALAVGEKIKYVKVKHNFDGAGEQNFIVAKNLVTKIFKDKEFTELETIEGSDLVGMAYIPLFDFYSKDEKLTNRQNGWKIYSADFVTTEEGTGIVHIAPAFGEDDLILSQKENIPFVQHVNIDGTIKEEVEGFAGLQAKPAENPQATDIEVLKKLAHEGKLFDKEKFTHSYPHCWRTDVPLLNYAMSSWFVRVTDFKDKLIKENRKIRWVPKNIGEKRFGNWLKNIKDWGISRSRYWGTPMPIWKSEDGTEIEVLGSVFDVKERTRGTNKYFILRHGEGEHNVRKFLSSDDSSMSHVTEKGRADIVAVAKKVKNQNIDVIYTSPLARTRETAEIIIKECGLNENILVIDDRLKEIQTGIYNGKTEDNIRKSPFFKDRFNVRPEGGENLVDVKKRVGEFIYEIDSTQKGKNILIVSHDWPIWMLDGIRSGADNKELESIKQHGKSFIQVGELREYDFAPIPHDDEFRLDLHRPYIDKIIYQKNGKEMRRIPEIFDTWFDSGSVPYAAHHYPFEDEMSPGGFLKKSKNYPADFIAEGLDQTRGWFYTLLALNVALFGKAPYKNVIANGLILAEDGRKMSKRLNNYPEPIQIINKYGADPLRLYLLSSQVVEAESLTFSEKGVDEVYKKVISRLLNVVSFYEMYRDDVSVELGTTAPKSKNIIDEWIISRLHEVTNQTTDGLEKYKLNTGSRLFFGFVDDLSTWYIRRSRDRFKGQDREDKKIALQTTYYVLNQFSKVLAPFIPFTAEEVFQRVNNLNYKNPNKSVHLESWFGNGDVEQNILDEMKIVREIVSLGLLERDKAGIKVRQPLSTLKITDKIPELNETSLQLIKEEVNVKQVIHDEALAVEEVQLDTGITEELQQEGDFRELVRFIQNLRKSNKLEPQDEIKITIQTEQKGRDLIEKFKSELLGRVKAKSVTYQDNDGEILNISDFNFQISI